jgi:hypothetical protein
MADKFFLYPFAFAGTRTAIPDDTQLSGSISYQEGYGPDYALDQFSDPDAKNIERGKWNQLLYDITNVIRSLQTVTYPAFITSADNGGTPYSYGVGAMCRFDPGSGMKNYRSKVSSNTTDPSNTTNWEEVGIFATNAIALTGTSTTAYMTPANTKWVIDNLVTSIASTYAPLASPAFTGNPTVPNQSPLTNNTRAANTAYVDAAIAAIPSGSFLPLAGGSMSGALNTAKGTDIASAGTTNIGAATGNFVHITGTTTITAFDTVQAGTERVLKFDGILTLTHNATSLILPTGANITTAAGDIAEFTSEGSGNWRCTNYMRASGAPLGGGGISSTNTIVYTQATDTCTISNASPSVITPSLGARTCGDNDSPVRFTTTGTLPTGFSTGVTYWIINSNGTTYNLSATKGGAAINTSSAGSGTHTVISAPYVKPVNLAFVNAKVVGASGGTGGAATGSTSSGASAGGYSEDNIDAASLSASEDIAVGIGGAAGNTGPGNGTDGTTSSFGTSPFIQATGGGASSASSGAAMPGAPGEGSGGSINLRGGYGQVKQSNVVSGMGGLSALGGNGGNRDTQGVGIAAARNSGSGPGGSYSSVSAQNGQVGSTGRVIVTEYLS